MKTSKELIENMADSIIERLENFNGTWENPFASSIHYNIFSKKAYKGINILFLSTAAAKNGFTSKVWGTFKQWTDKGYKIKKGAKSQQIVLWKPNFYTVEEENEESGELEQMEKLGFLLRVYSVFNGSQIENFTESEEKNDFNFRADYKEFFDNTGIKYNFTSAGQAFYMPSLDEIQLPNIKDFYSEEGFIATLSHEMTHATGHPSRLNRNFSGRFGSEAYAFEELVAEIGAGFVCAYLGVNHQLSDNNIAYIKSWLKVLKEDKRRILTACSFAQSAFDWLLAQQEK